MVSLRAVCNSIGLAGKMSIMNDFLGYPTNHNLKDNYEDFRVSILEQVKLLKSNGLYFNLSIIKANIEYFLPLQHRLISMSIFHARKIYAKIGIGIGRIWYSYIPDAAEQSPEVLEECDLADMVEYWSGYGDGIDVFYVLDLVDGAGSSPYGSCDKDTSTSGLFIEIQNLVTKSNYFPLGLWYRAIGFTLAHELGHYFGNPHDFDDPSNLMWPNLEWHWEWVGGKLVATSDSDFDPNGINITQSQIEQILHPYLSIGDSSLSCWIRVGTAT